MLIAGLTGGIATGKSTVSRIFKQYGAVIIDADEIARQVVALGQPAWRAVTQHFGSRIQQPDGSIDRALLGSIVFNDPQSREQLEAIVHPWVRAEIKIQLARLQQTTPNAVVIQDIPLLLETGIHKDLDEIIVVYAPEALQLERLIQRDQMEKADALARIQSQMPIEEKRRRGTIVIDNSGTLASTQKQTFSIFHELSLRAKQPTTS